jgi:hypothetical protein
MTLVEVIIGVGILVVATFAALSALGSLHTIQDEANIQFKVHRLARILEERIRGCPWSQLGQWQGTSTGDDTHNALVWHRRQTPAVSGVASFLPPLSEGADVGHDNNLGYQLATRDERSRVNSNTLLLSSLGTGIPEVKVYVEYYTSDVVLQSMTSTTPQSTWKSLTRGPFASSAFVFPESPGGPFTGTQMDLSNYNLSLCIRVVIEWKMHKTLFFHEFQVVRRG